jgi:predicted RNA-binding protein associated with RNAse of E/G family
MSSSGQYWPKSIVMHVAAAAVEQAVVNYAQVNNRLVLATGYLALHCRTGLQS